MLRSLGLVPAMASEISMLTILHFALALGTAAAAPEGHFCELVHSDSVPARVSCFELRNTPDGPTLEGTAFSFVRVEDGEKMGPPPVVATWKLNELTSYDPESLTLAYSYTAEMRGGDEPIHGTSSVSFATEAAEGWYRSGRRTFRFQLLSLDALEACLEVRSSPRLPAMERYERVATSTAGELKRCVPPTSP